MSSLLQIQIFDYVPDDFLGQISKKGITASKLWGLGSLSVSFHMARAVLLSTLSAQEASLWCPHLEAACQNSALPALSSVGYWIHEGAWMPVGESVLGLPP